MSLSYVGDLTFGYEGSVDNVFEMCIRDRCISASGPSIILQCCGGRKVNQEVLQWERLHFCFPDRALRCV